MLHNQIIARPGLTAIAAVLALSATPLNAQEIEPVTTESTAPVESTAPATEPAPETTASDPLAPVEAEPASAAPATTAEKPAAKTTKPVRSAPTASRSTAAKATPAAASSAPAAPTMAETPAPVTPVPPMPVEEMAANPMTPDVAAPESNAFAVDIDQALPIAGAAGLAIAGFAGIGFTMRRRRRRNADPDANLSYSDAHMWHEPAVARAEPTGATPVTAAPVVATPRHDPHTIRASTVAAPSSGWTTPSAFSWGNTAPVAVARVQTGNTDESRIDAALRGPTPDNPFLSLKKRLRRAAFFDQRERAVREGNAKPLSPMAGLPKAMADRTANFVRGGNVAARPELVPA